MPRYLVFGATGHIGGPLAMSLAKRDGVASLRLCSSRANGASALKQSHPDADVRTCDMLNMEQMISALHGIDAVFIVTPDFFDDRHGAETLVAAAQQLGRAPHVVRIQAEIPGVGIDDLPGLISQPIGRRGHLEARNIISSAGLPATFMNVLGYYMDDFLIHFAGPLKAEAKLLVPYDRPMCFVDPSELGEAAAAIMAGPVPEGAQLLHFNNGEDGQRFSDVAAMMCKASGRRVEYVDDAEVFRATVGPALTEITGDPQACEYLLADWRMERDHAQVYRGTSHLGRLIGRQPKTLAAWIDEHAADLL